VAFYRPRVVMNDSFFRLKPRRKNDDGYTSGFKKITGITRNREDDGDKEALYVFGDLDLSEEDIETENVGVFQLQNLEEKSAPDGMKYVDRKIKPGDTLRGLSLRYNVQLAVLRQINNLISEQDFYSLKEIKIPIQTAYSSRFELLKEDAQQESLPSTSFKDHPEIISSNNLPHEPNVCSLSVGRTLDVNSDNGDFFKKMDEDLEKIRSLNDSRKDSLERVIESLTEQRFQPMSTCERFWKWRGGRSSDEGSGKKSWAWCGLFLITVASLLVIIYFISTNHVPRKEDNNLVPGHS